MENALKGRLTRWKKWEKIIGDCKGGVRLLIEKYNNDTSDSTCK